MDEIEKLRMEDGLNLLAIAEERKRKRDAEERKRKRIGRR